MEDGRNVLTENPIMMDVTIFIANEEKNIIPTISIAKANQANLHHQTFMNLNRGNITTVIYSGVYFIHNEISTNMWFRHMEMKKCNFFNNKV